MCFLNFVRQWEGSFYVIIFNNAFDGRDHAPDKVFLGRTILVAGMIETFENCPQIRVHDARQIVIVEPDQLELSAVD